MRGQMIKWPAYQTHDLFKSAGGGGGGGGAQWCSLNCSTSTSKVAGLNLDPGTLGWKVGSSLPMPGGLQDRILTN